jgi:ligand-binding sensor domain-containing protein
LLVYDGQKWSAKIAAPEAIKQAYAQLQASRSHFEKPNLYRPLSKVSDVFCGLADRDGYIWLGTRHMILRVEERKKEWTYYSLPHNLGQVRYMYEDNQSRLWVSDDWGRVAVFDKRAFAWHVYRLEEPTLDTLTPEAFFPIFSMCQGKNGQMMFTTIIGLMTLDETLNKWKIYDPRNSALPTDFVTTIMADRHNRVWLGTGRGILLLGQ